MDPERPRENVLMADKARASGNEPAPTDFRPSPLLLVALFIGTAVVVALLFIAL